MARAPAAALVVALALLCASPALAQNNATQPTGSSNATATDCSVRTAEFVLSEFNSSLLFSILNELGVKDLPANYAFFLPSDVALLETLAKFPGMNITGDITAYFDRNPLLLRKILSIVLYHIVPNGGKLDLTTVSTGGTIITSLDGYLFYYDNTTNLLLDNSGVQAIEYLPLFRACGSNFYLIDKVLLPAETVDMLPVIDDASFGAWLSTLSGETPKNGTATPADSPAPAPADSAAPAPAKSP